MAFQREKPKEGEEKESGFSRLHMLNCGGIPRLPHTIAILSYTCDTNIDTTCYTVYRFTKAAYGM